VALTGNIAANTAPTTVFSVIGNKHTGFALWLQPGFQNWKTPFDFATAFTVMIVFAVNVLPAGDEVIVPLPSGDNVSVYCAGFVAPLPLSVTLVGWKFGVELLKLSCAL
jgi:hypothetical protein